MNSHYWGNVDRLQSRRDKGEIDKEKFNELERAETRRAAEEFNRALRTDAYMTLRELRNRIPYENRKHIPGLPDIKPADPRAGSVSLYTALPGEFSLFWSDMLAREIEESVKLLPGR